MPHGVPCAFQAACRSAFVRGGRGGQEPCEFSVMAMAPLLSESQDGAETFAQELVADAGSHVVVGGVDPGVDVRMQMRGIDETVGKSVVGGEPAGQSDGSVEWNHARILGVRA